MQVRHRSMLLAAASLLASAPLAYAQHAANPSGHWEGAIKLPNQAIAVQIDLGQNDQGVTRGTFTGVNIAGYPLSDITVDGSAIKFLLKVDGGGRFSGTVGTDGTMTGEFVASQGDYTLPFSLTRSGDARFDPPTSSPAIAKNLEGHWAGTLEVNGIEMHITLTMANGPDGKSGGTLANLDQGGVEIPIAAITQSAGDVRLDVKAVNGSYAGALNAAGTELAGTWTQGSFSAPLTFHRK